jgi:leucyl-tRNA synthetase
MSKSQFNVVSPEALIARFGADTERVYTLFIAPPDKEAEWSDDGVIGAHRFLGRVWAMGEAILGVAARAADAAGQAPSSAALVRKTHQTIAAVTLRMERFDFNTAISGMMELSNAMGEYVAAGGSDTAVLRESFEALLRLLHPFAPHMTEELWELFGHEGFILNASWPEADPAKMVEDSVTIVVQVNGKLRGQVEVPNPPQEDAVFAAVDANEKVQTWLAGKQIVKKVYVPGKLVNVVVK